VFSQIVCSDLIIFHLAFLTINCAAFECTNIEWYDQPIFTTIGLFEIRSTYLKKLKLLQLKLKFLFSSFQLLFGSNFKGGKILLYMWEDFTS